MTEDIHSLKRLVRRVGELEHVEHVRSTVTQVDLTQRALVVIELAAGVGLIRLARSCRIFTLILGVIKQ